MAVDAARAAETHLPRILGVTAAFHVLALILVACRIYTRACLVKSFGKDDALIIWAALCVLCGGMTVLIVSGEHGLGRHTDTLSDDDIKMYNMLCWIQSLLVSSMGMAAIKVSVGLSLLRLSTNHRFRQLVWGLIGFTGIYWALCFLSIVLYCHPIAGLWDETVEAVCYPTWVFIRFGFFNTACNIFTDVCFATAPLPLIWSLRLDRRVQLYLVAIFSLGYFAVAMAVAKGICQAAFWSDSDRTFDHWIQVFGFLEANVSLIAASVPALKPLLGRWFGLPHESACRSPAPETTRPGARRNAAAETNFDIEAELGLNGKGDSGVASGGGNGDSHYVSGKEGPFCHVGGGRDVVTSCDESAIVSTLQAPSDYAAEFNDSREHILHGKEDERDPIRIMKTTEVTVSRS